CDLRQRSTTRTRTSSCGLGVLSSSRNSFNRCSRRATRTSVRARVASWRANSRPIPAEAPVINALQPSIFISSHVYEQRQNYTANDSSNMTGHTDIGKQRDTEPGSEHDPNRSSEAIVAVLTI